MALVPEFGRPAEVRLCDTADWTWKWAIGGDL